MPHILISFLTVCFYYTSNMFRYLGTTLGTYVRAEKLSHEKNTHIMYVLIQLHYNELKHVLITTNETLITFLQVKSNVHVPQSTAES